MGQYWAFYNIDKRENLSLGMCLKMGDWFSTKWTLRNAHMLLQGPKSWAGDRIICLGDYACVRDLPEGMFTPKELEELGFREKHLRPPSPVESKGVDHYQPQAIHSWSGIGYYDSNKMERDDDSLEINEALSRICKKKSASFEVGYYDDYSKYVVRNLSKKQYFRGGCSRNLENGTPSIGQALFSLICWSSDPSVSMYMPKNVSDISRGIWAGDRLDLILLEDVEELLEEEEWTDLSEDVRFTVETIMDYSDAWY